MVRIVVGYEGSEQSHDAVALATMLAESTGAELVLAMAFPHLEPSPDFEYYCRELAQESDPLVAEASPLLREGGREFRTRAMGGVPAAQALADVARSENANLLVGGGARGSVQQGGAGARARSFHRAPPEGGRRPERARRGGSGRELAEQERAVDLMTIGSHGHGTVLRALLGSVSTGRAQRALAARRRAANRAGRAGRVADIIERNMEKTNLVAGRPRAPAGDGRPRRAAYRVLRTFLHAVRDRLTVDEAARLAAPTFA